MYVQLIYFNTSGFESFNTYGKPTIKFWTHFVLYRDECLWTYSIVQK